MDRSALKEAMMASISEVLEQMFFLPVDILALDSVASNRDEELDKSVITAKLAFRGSPSGTFLLQMPTSLALSVSADFLGAALHDLGIDQAEGTILEMLNMLAGSTLSNYDRSVLFDLHIPELITGDSVQSVREEFDDQIVLLIQAPSGRMTYQVILVPAG